MKRPFLSLVFVCCAAVMFAQLGITRIYVTEQGAGNNDGTSFSNAFNQIDFLNEIHNPGMYSNDIEVYIGKGNYGNFWFYPLPAAITSVSLYGGFEGTKDFEQLTERDLINNITCIYQSDTLYPAIWYEVVQGGNVNVIDGVTINASAPRQGSAIRMVASPCIFSKCRIENSYVPNSTLIFLETNMKMEAAFINCVISNNSCLQIFHTIYDISLINSVIADNNTDILFNVSNHHNEDKPLGSAPTKS